MHGISACYIHPVNTPDKLIFAILNSKKDYLLIQVLILYSISHIIPSKEIIFTMMLKKGIPRHIQITQWLNDQIEDGHFKPDEKLPSENELAKKFDVSRVTIRRALQSLESEQVIYRCQGLGSFVSDSRKKHNLVKLTDFDEDMAQAGIEASSQVIRFETVESPQWLAGRLGIAEGQKVLQIDRLRLGDGEPIAFDSTWLPLFYGQLLNKDDLSDRTIYSVLEDEYDIPVQKGCYRLSATSASGNLSKHLQVAPNTPLFLIERITYTIGEKAIYYQKRYYRNDQVMYEMTLERDQNDKSNSGDMPLKEFVPVFKSQQH
jgi:GntR family transcriptional regulator